MAKFIDGKPRIFLLQKKGRGVTHYLQLGIFDRGGGGCERKHGI